MSTDSQNVNVHSCHLLFDHFQFALIYGPNILGSYAISLFTASNPASITSPIYNWVLFSLWLHTFILSGVISLLIQQHIGHLLTWGVHLSVSYLFAFSYCSWGSQGKNTEVDNGMWSHHFMGNRWGNSGNSVRLYLWRLQNHCRWSQQP